MPFIRKKSINAKTSHEEPINSLNALSSMTNSQKSIQTDKHYPTLI
jgi:hypothetical protein